MPSPERVIISVPPWAELRWTTATPHITFGTVSRQDSSPGSPGDDFQIAKLNGTSTVQQGAAADPAEIHGILNYENHFSVASLDSGPISTLINEPAEDQESMVIDQPSPSSSDSVHELVDLDPQPQGDMEAEPPDQEPPAPHLEGIVANPVAPDADMPPAAQGHDAEPEEDVPVLEEAHDDNPLAIVLYKPPHI
ncbi:hypothetical protein D1007_21241 [Hordeum vulgare]|nr:hypothetical protein D1007_21241 [Hordeum vulgare]